MITLEEFCQMACSLSGKRFEMSVLKPCEGEHNGRDMEQETVLFTIKADNELDGWLTECWRRGSVEEVYALDPDHFAVAVTPKSGGHTIGFSS